MEFLNVLVHSFRGKDFYENMNGITSLHPHLGCYKNLSDLSLCYEQLDYKYVPPFKLGEYPC